MIEGWILGLDQSLWTKSPTDRHSGTAQPDPESRDGKVKVIQKMQLKLVVADNLNHTNLWIPGLASRSRNDGRGVFCMDKLSVIDMESQPDRIAAP